MTLDFSRCRLAPYAHQKIGIQALLDHEFFMLADEMGAGKTLQTIVAAQFLFEQGVIDHVVIVAPASVRNVWYDDELGELRKHLFVPSRIRLYHGKMREWAVGLGADRLLVWTVTNYEFIRATSRLDPLLEDCNKRTLVVLDESSAVKNYRAAQTKACMALRKKSGRVVLLNGTPIANSPMDLFSQGNLMSPKILDCGYITHFQARYAEMGGYEVRTPWGTKPTQVVGWKNLEDLQQRFAPYVLRRLKKDCLDLPPVLDAVELTATLSKETWKIYKEMRDEMVAWLANSSVSVAPQTITKILRLSQITSGFIGGLEAEVVDPLLDDRPEWLPTFAGPDPLPSDDRVVQELGREKLDVTLGWIDRLLEENDPNLKLLLWCRFVPELQRMLRELAERYPQAQLGSIAGRSMFGGKLRAERDAALRLLDPRTAPAGPAFVGGTYGTGSLGLNLTACHTVVNVSYDYSYWKFEQSAARVDRPGQVHPVSTFDIVAVGPQGQRTIDHAIVRARRAKEDVATWTTSAWVQALSEE